MSCVSCIRMGLIDCQTMLLSNFPKVRHENGNLAHGDRWGMVLQRGKLFEKIVQFISGKLHYYFFKILLCF